MSAPPDREVRLPRQGELDSEQLSPATRWVLLEGDRRVLAAGLLAGLAVVFGGALGTSALAVENGGALGRLFGAFIGGNLTLITVVITINQVILSREFGSPGELQARIADVVGYKHDVESAAGVDVSPVTPRAFAEFLNYQLRTEAADIKDESESIADAEYRETLDRYAETLVTQSETIEDALLEREGSAFDTLLTVLNVDFATDRYTAERLRAKAGGDVPPTVTDGLDDIVSLIDHIGAARQYLMTLYMQRELADLSQKILYSGVPAVSISVLAVWVYGHPTGATLTSPLLEGVVVLAVVVAMGPLAILFAYVIRITTVTQETVSLLPFKSRGMETT